MKKLVLLCCFASVLFLASCTQQSGESRIYNVEALKYEKFPEYDSLLASGTNCLSHIPVPTVTYFPAPKPNGTAVIVCPGGGYGKVCFTREGIRVSRWLNTLGISAFVLKYRLPVEGNRHPIPLADAQRAIRLVRCNAQKYGLDPHRIGIMGFSAGGHLASTAGTHFDYGDKTSQSKVQQTSCRPDFMVLVYPVITLEKPYTHMGSRNNLLGDLRDDQRMIKELSNNLQVTKDTPPNFLVHANDDDGVKPENSILFNCASKQAGVPSQLNIYQKGGHGFDLGRENTDSANWPKQCEKWLRARVLID